MDEKFLKPYDPKATEGKIYKLWEQSGFFNPDVCIEKGFTKVDAEPFSIVLPPPNVTGTLHMGSSLMLAIEDTVVRFERMRGKKTLWIPGMDHAAIATQSRVEKLLEKEGKRKADLGREEFLKRVEKFADENKAIMKRQLKALGSSLDWSREAFTLDEKRELAVRTAFKKMYDEELIYRGHRIVNWDPKGQTTISDDEILYKEEKGKFYYLKYGPFTIGTARPETKFGDKYVVMHPKDKRYKKYKDGEKLDLEWINGPITATIVKDDAIDMEFGTGVMTITPWHSNADFDIAERHKLDKEQIIDTHGRLLPIAGEFAGTKISEARPKIVEKLRAKGLLEKEEDYTHNVATAERTGGIIEPQIMKQWFIDVNKPIPSRGKKTLKELMLEAVEKDGVKIMPERFEKVYFHWIENLRDWCISRQIWYGHRIPVWYKDNEIYCGIEAPKGEDWKQDEDTLDTWFSAGLWTFSTLGWPAQKIWDLKIADGNEIFESLRNGQKRFETRAGKPEGVEKDWREFKVGDVINFSLIEEKTERVISKKPITKQIISIHHFDSISKMLEKLDVNEIHPYKPKEYESWWKERPKYQERVDKYGIWAFELKDWDLTTYHPTALLETGYDILFFWIARMILMSKYLLDEIPFKTVYLHGLVRDGKGQKISKSLGNNVEPLEMIEKYGADAVRMSLLVGTGAGNDSRMSEEKLKAYKHIANKLWNIARFVLSTTENFPASGTQKLTEHDKELEAERDELVRQMTEEIENYNLHIASERIYHYVWHRFADAILEESKKIFADGSASAKNSRANFLRQTLEIILKLLHPFMPFLSEEIWQLWKKETLLIVEKWPT